MENEQVVDNQGDGQQTTTPDALDNIIIDGGEQHETDTVVEGEENGEESAKTGDEPAKDDSQKSVQKAIDKQYRLRREAEEKAAELAAPPIKKSSNPSPLTSPEQILGPCVLII